MTIKKLCAAVLAGTLVLGAPAAFADDDDDDHDSKKRRHSERKKKGRTQVHHHHYYYISRGGVIEGPFMIPPAPPGVHAERHSPHALDKPLPKSAPAFPRESPAEHSSARERQRNLLEKELAAEQDLLDRARKALADSYGAPERTQPLRDDVELHERNIAALRRELSHLGR